MGIRQKEERIVTKDLYRNKGKKVRLQTKAVP